MLEMLRKKLIDAGIDPAVGSMDYWGTQLEGVLLDMYDQGVASERQLRDELYAQEMEQPTPTQSGIISITVNKGLESDIDLLWQVNSADVEALEDAKETLEIIRKTAPITLNPIIYQSLALIYKALSMSHADAFQRIIDKARGQSK
jgi:chlorite dismutase